mgnify:CR=1 FL=1
MMIFLKESSILRSERSSCSLFSSKTHCQLDANLTLVQNGIEHLLEGRTSFVIAHRLSTIQKADRIFVIDEGGICEQGTANELMAKQGIYYNLYMAQFAGIA